MVLTEFMGHFDCDGGLTKLRSTTEGYKEIFFVIQKSNDVYTSSS